MSEREELITSNLGLVHSCASRFKGRGIEYEDLFQIGCIGLIKAADGFDKSRGLMFSTYAVPTILGEIKRIFRDTGAVKVSRSIKELGIKALSVKEKLEFQSGNEVGVGLIAETMGLSAAEVGEALCALQPTVSLTSYDDDKDEQIDLPVIGEETLISNKLFLDGLMKNLNSQEVSLIKLRYYYGKTQSESAKMLNMTQVQISRMEKKILGKLRSMTDESISA